MADQEKKKDVPEIRFAGFTDPWEQRKLSEFLEVSSEKNDDNFFGRNDVLSVSKEFGVVNQIEFQGRSFAGADLSNYGILRHGYIVYTKSPLKDNPFGIVKSNNGSSGIVSTLYAIYQPLKSALPNFVDCYFSQDARVNDYLHPLISKGAKNDMKVSAENALKGGVVFPSIAEQQQICCLFSSLDSLITLHQRECDQLKTFKKSMLEKMFPREGESVPEIRFAGFTDPWEQRKLGELLTFQNGFNGSSNSFGSGVPLISVMDVLAEGFISYDSIKGKASVTPEEADRFSVEYGDVLFQRSSENYEDAGSTNVYLDQLKRAIFGGFVIRGRKTSDYEPRFIKYALRSRGARNQITRRAQGAQHINVSQDTLERAVLPMPSLAEQRRVGALFSSLDSLITLHQRELELLKNIKKSLLEKMFV